MLLYSKEHRLMISVVSNGQASRFMEIARDAGAPGGQSLDTSRLKIQELMNLEIRILMLLMNSCKIQ